jgi:hypothetical protein
MVGCLLKIDETHEPEFVPVNGDNLNVLLWWTFFHDNWVDCAYFSQGYHNLLKEVFIIELINTNIDVIISHRSKIYCEVTCDCVVYVTITK